MTDDLAPLPARPEKPPRRRGPLIATVLLLLGVGVVLFVTLVKRRDEFLSLFRIRR